MLLFGRTPSHGKFHVETSHKHAYKCYTKSVFMLMTNMATRNSDFVTEKLNSCPCALTEHHAMKANWGSGGLTPRILDLGARGRWVVSFTPRPLYPQGKSLWYPLGGTRRQSGHGGEEKNSQSLQGLEPSTILPAAQRYTTELSQLLLETAQVENIRWRLNVRERSTKHNIWT
jgi:hypothetical protein